MPFASPILSSVRFVDHWRAAPCRRWRKLERGRGPCRLWQREKVNIKWKKFGLLIYVDSSYVELNLTINTYFFLFLTELLFTCTTPHSLFISPFHLNINLIYYYYFPSPLHQIFFLLPLPFPILLLITHNNSNEKDSQNFRKKNSHKYITFDWSVGPATP